MEFWQPAPFALTEESGTFYMDWAVLPVNVGYTQAEVEAQVGSILSDPRGWERAGIVARHNTTSPKVVFEIVTEAEGETPEAARTFWDEDPVRVSIEEQYLDSAALGWENLVNHESGHAFFSGTHEGEFGIMNDFGDGPSRVDWPVDGEIAAVVAWLEDATGGAYWFPADLETYITRWILSGEVRLSATVLSGVAGTGLRAVWGTSREGMLEGRINELTSVVSTTEAGFFTSEWQAVPAAAVSAGEVYVGITVKRPSAFTDLQDLIVGLAEVQIRSTT